MRRKMWACPLLIAVQACSQNAGISGSNASPTPPATAPAPTLPAGNNEAQRPAAAPVPNPTILPAQTTFQTPAPAVPQPLVQPAPAVPQLSLTSLEGTWVNGAGCISTGDGLYLSGNSRTYSDATETMNGAQFSDSACQNPVAYTNNFTATVSVVPESAVPATSGTLLGPAGTLYLTYEDNGVSLYDFVYPGPTPDQLYFWDVPTPAGGPGDCSLAGDPAPVTPCTVDQMLAYMHLYTRQN